MNLSKLRFGAKQSAAPSPSLEAPLPPSSLLRLVQENATVLDLRGSCAFADGFIPGSLSVPQLDSETRQILSDLNWLRSIYLIAEDENQVKAWIKQSGSESFAGWFHSESVAAWQRCNASLPSIQQITSENLKIRLAGWKTVVIDIRSDQEFAKLDCPDAIHIPMKAISSSLFGLPKCTSIVLIGRTLEEAVFCASLLWTLGYTETSVLEPGANLNRREPVIRSNAQ